MCQQHGGHLITIQNVNEVNDIAALIKQMSKHTNKQNKQKTNNRRKASGLG